MVREWWYIIYAHCYKEDISCLDLLVAGRKQQRYVRSNWTLQFLKKREKKKKKWVCWRPLYFPQFSPKHVYVIWCFDLWPAFQIKQRLRRGDTRDVRVFWGGRSRGYDWLLSATQPINPSCWQANEPLSLLVCTSSNPLIPSFISCINYSVLCGSPVSVSLHWSPAQIVLLQGEQAERQEGSCYKSGFETTYLILKAKLLQWQLNCSVSPVDSPKWYCLLQSLNIMSWACKYMSMAYDHPPEGNSKGSKKEQMLSYRFLFQPGLQLSLSMMSRLSWNVWHPGMYFLLLASLLRQQFSQHQQDHAEVTGSFASLPVEKAVALCLLWELCVCTKLSTTGPDLRLRGALVAVLAQMRDIVQRNQITPGKGSI